MGHAKLMSRWPIFKKNSPPGFPRKKEHPSFFRQKISDLTRAFEKPVTQKPGYRFLTGRAALILWGVLFFGLFFLREFPANDVARYLLTQMGPDVKATARTAVFTPPLGLAYQGLAITATAPSGPVDVDIDRAKGNIDLVTLVSGKPRYNFDLKMYGGEFKGHLRRFLHGKVSHLNGQTTSPIDLSTTKQLTHQDLSGLMNLETDYTWKTGLEEKGKGTLSLSIARLTIRSLNMNGFPLPPIAFQHVHGIVNLANGLGHIERLEADGPMAHLTGTGDVSLANPYQRSLVNLDFDISLRGELGKLPLPSISGKNGSVIHLHLAGQLASPQVTLNGIVLPR